MNILLSILAVLAVIGVGGFAAFKLWGNRLINLAIAKKPGNASEYDASTVMPKQNSPLRDKTIIFLGSSVTAGKGGCGTSFVQYLEAMDGVIPIQEAVSGTTLVSGMENSYVTRMETIDKSIAADAFICQLSSNDASQGMPLGQMSDSFDKVAFDTATIAGAMEYIIAYARETWNCPVLFYTGTKYDSTAYAAMVELLLKLQDKWNIGVIDLWSDEELNAISDAERSLYMLDNIHPTKAGYLKWWIPAMESYLYDYLGE